MTQEFKDLEQEKVSEQLDIKYEKFMAGLQKLSQKYGFAIQACGCFYWDLNGFKEIEYKVDRSSGDIMFKKLVFSDGEEL